MPLLNLQKRSNEISEDELAFVDPSPEIKARAGERHLFAEHLVKLGLVRQVEAQAAILEQKVVPGDKIGQILVRNGFLPRDQLVTTLLEFDAERIATERVDSSRIPFDILEELNIIITAQTEQTIYCASLSDEDQVLEVVKEYYPEKNVVFVTFHPDNLPEFLDRMRVTDAMDAGNDNVRSEDMLDKLLYTAIQKGASDIHIEPRERSYSVFFRFLGERLHTHEGTEEEYHTITAQIKDKSNIDVAERRIPQDGVFQIEHSGKIIDLRVATIPLVKNEKSVIRILDSTAVNPQLEKLGISPVQHWIKGIDRQNGICLICGPTGSGKTTTLSATVRRMDRFGKSIYMVEDPVEYRIPYVSQVNVNRVVGLDFARAVRAFMRGDPEVIIIGEIRDDETAQNALRAAETGHLAIGTLHTQTILSSLARMSHLGIEQYQLRDILRSVLVQNLVRTTCLVCAGAGHRFDETCPNCRGTGYGGRTVVSECVSFTYPRQVDELLEMAKPGSPVPDKLPWTEIIDDALDLMLTKKTSSDELYRVFGELALHRFTERGIDPAEFKHGTDSFYDDGRE